MSVFRLRLVLADNDRCKGTIAVGGHIKLVEDEVHREDGATSGLCHVDIGDGNLGVGSALLACQTDGLLCSKVGRQGKEEYGDDFFHEANGANRAYEAYGGLLG